jgi:serine protease AprX
MTKMLKVFCSGTEQKELAKQYRIVAAYAAFAVIEATEEQAGQIAQSYPVEDITSQYAIQLEDSTIDTSRPRIDRAGKAAAHPAYKASKPLPPGPHHYLVQFVGPIKDAWLAGIKKAKAEPRAPFADFTWVVRADADALKRIAELPYVRWVGHLPPRARVDDAVYQRIGRKAGDVSGALPRTRVLPGTYKVEFFAPADLTAALSAVKRLGFKVLGKNSSGKVLVVEAPQSAAARKKAIDALSSVHGVRAIRENSLKRTSNDVAAGIMGTAAALAGAGLGLSGKGEIIAVCDTGLDTGDAKSIHPDFSGRVKWIKSYPITSDFDSFVQNPGGNDGPADLDSGHGTHTSGSVLGSGASSAGLPGLAGPIRGLAHEARLVFQAVEQELKWKDPADFRRYGRYLLAGIPLDLSQLFLDAYKQGARVHSDSWGGGVPGAYDSQCEQLDRFVWEHKTFCVVVAAGNDGTDKDGDGKINPMSVSAPGTAKNCITVGACENLRAKFDGETYGEWWPSDYPAAPYKAAPMADNADQVVAFSSRGPTKDGRVKPEVVAPGTFILSTRSTMIAANNTAWAAFPPSRLYFYMGGTSMATPLTAGAVALVRQYLRKKRGIASPSAALLKATLIAGATRLPGTAPASAIVDSDQGFGRVNLDAVLAPATPAVSVFLDVKPGLRTGQVNKHKLTVKSSAVTLRVVLAYSDYPGPDLVNNLNLIVTAPGGQRYLGNQAAAGATAVDVDNNVEVVQVAQPVTGAWTIEVIGSNVPQGPQAFALVCLGGVA